MALGSLRHISPRFAAVVAGALMATSALAQTQLAAAEAKPAAETASAEANAAPKAEAAKPVAAKAEDTLAPLTLINFHEMRYDAEGKEDLLAVLRTIVEHPDAVVIVNYRSASADKAFSPEKNKIQDLALRQAASNVRSSSQQPVFFLDVVVVKDVTKNGKTELEFPWLSALHDALETNELGKNKSHVDINSDKGMVFTPYFEVFAHGKFVSDGSLNNFNLPQPKQPLKTEEEKAKFDAAVLKAVTNRFEKQLSSIVSDANTKTLEAKNKDSKDNKPSTLSLGPK